MKRLFTLSLSLWLFACVAIRADEFDVLRLRWQNQLTGGTNLDTTNPAIANRLASLSAAARSDWRQLNRASDRAWLWRDDAGWRTNSSRISGMYYRLRVLALAYATRGTALYGNPALLSDLRLALDWMHAHAYNEGRREYYNWWDWEIGTPLALNDITVLLYNHLSPKQVSDYMRAVNHFSPTPDLTAANRVWKATVVAVRGVLVKDSDKIAAARDALSDVFPYVTHGDGFYRDGSFIQHRDHPYTGGYGSALLADLGPLLALLHGSPWHVTDPKERNVFHWITDSFQPVIYKGAMMDMVRGREISRPGAGDHGSGQSVIASIIRLAQIAPPAEAQTFRRMVKYWIQADTSRDFIVHAPLSILSEAQAILDDPHIVPRGELRGQFDFARMDRFVHFGPGFAVGLSLSSRRIARYESINQENLHGWYTGAGMLYLYDGDLTQFDDNYWPTVDPYRLPGTTVSMRRRTDGSGQGTRPPCDWVGGAALAHYGVVGMQFHEWHSSLTAKKSWFFFDRKIVCLGTGITSKGEAPVETIVENRRLLGAGDNALAVDGITQPTALGWSATLTNVTWADLAGNVRGADIGYFFPQPTTVHAVRQTRTGTWHAINGRVRSSRPYTRNYLTLWIDHGQHPNGATYAYVLLPNQSAGAVAAYAANPELRILANSPRAQAVRDRRLGLTAVNFWQDGPSAVASLAVDHKASVILQTSGNELTVAVADPTQTNQGHIDLEVTQPFQRVVSADLGVIVQQLHPILKISVNVRHAGGKSFRATFARR